MDSFCGCLAWDVDWEAVGALSTLVVGVMSILIAILIEVRSRRSAQIEKSRLEEERRTRERGEMIQTLSDLVQLGAQLADYGNGLRVVHEGLKEVADRASDKSVEISPSEAVPLRNYRNLASIVCGLTPNHGVISRCSVETEAFNALREATLQFSLFRTTTSVVTALSENTQRPQDAWGNAEMLSDQALATVKAVAKLDQVRVSLESGVRARLAKLNESLAAVRVK